MPSLKPALKNWGHGHWLAILLLPLTTLFFIGGPDSTALPSVRHLWNLGHIAFFFCATITWLHFRPLQSESRAFILLFAVLILSFAIEILQRSVGRDFSTMDILRNLTGTVFGALLVNRQQVHITVTSFFTLILLLDMGGFGFKLASDYSLQTQAPIIDNFENFATLSYWGSDIDYAAEPVLEGQFSAKLELQPSMYAGVFMSPLLLDWSGYRTLLIHVYSPRALEETLVVRVHDHAHELSDKNHNDRFNQAFHLQMGWNSLEINLRDIRMAPAERDMDLTRMYSLGIFVNSLQQPITLYLDDIRLSQ